ncbi:GDSL esterase/lipase At5g45950 [Cornus florida]|uniref:GDSL esterase/lipase At5g45950 n=1 Tax=Cornus florida TaxID=4283 RepID=UPI00289950CF|nr:GDSL esterase/lipase At5g45950 [Cornus florida]
MGVLTLMVILLVAAMSLHARAIDIHELRKVAAKENLTCVLVFGDSSVDPGNNNHLALAPKSNFQPYGRDFLNGSRPNGRFTDGRLATDFIAEALGYTNIIRPYLDPYIKKADLLHGVSFASAGSGYDEFTAINISKALSVSQQLKYFMKYKLRLKQLMGEKKVEKFIGNAIFIISMGTNDFLQNYYIDPFRSTQFTIEQYQNYLISCMFRYVKAMHTLGARRLAIVGVPPFGCMPLVKTLKDEIKCDDDYNQVALSFNSKIQANLETIKATLGIKNAYIDIYHIIERAIQNPKKYGIVDTTKGCCGSGTYEYGDTCKGLSTCADPTKYVFWDAVHLTGKMYKIIADEALDEVSENVLN